MKRQQLRSTKAEIAKKAGLEFDDVIVDALTHMAAGQKVYFKSSQDYYHLWAYAKLLDIDAELAVEAKYNMTAPDGAVVYFNR